MNQELVFGREVRLRDKGPEVKRVQEWLNLHATASPSTATSGA